MADAYIWPTWKVMEWKAHQHRSVFSCSERKGGGCRPTRGRWTARPVSVIRSKLRAVGPTKPSGWIGHWLTGEMTDDVIEGRYPPLVARHLISRRHFVLKSLSELRGMNLACWCAPSEACHADLLLELANAGEQTATADMLAAC